MSNILLETVREYLWPHRAQKAIPSLDGPWAADDRLEELPLVARGLDTPKDILADGKGGLLVAAGRTLLRFAGPDWRGTLAATLPADIHGLGLAGDFGIVASLAGHGISFIGGRRDGELIDSADGRRISCPMAAFLVAPDRLVVADASMRDNSEFRRDYLEGSPSGRLVLIELDSGRARTIIDGLDYPTSLALASDDRSLLVTEAWSHRISSIDLAATRPRLETKLGNLPGFPWRVLRVNSQYWLSFLSLRTQLLEFVRLERRFGAQMMAASEPDFWIAPATRTTGHFYEPVQGAQIKHHGFTKPWAPPRSYGLLARLATDLQPLETWHSRHGGARHGLCGLAQVDDRLFVLSSGAGVLLDAGRHG